MTREQLIVDFLLGALALSASILIGFAEWPYSWTDKWRRWRRR